MTFLEPIRELRLQVKLPIQSLERQVNPESTAKICLPGVEAARAISWREQLKGNFDELLEAECGLAWL